MVLPNILDHGRVSVSIVSHGQGDLVKFLLEDLRNWSGPPLQVILTFNVNEDISFLDLFKDLDIVVILNESPKGFGSNHNSAFLLSSGGYFAVVNPDVRTFKFSLAPLVETISRNDVGACGPRVVSPDGQLEDSARFFPSGTRIAKRTIFQQRRPDFEFADKPVVVDWVAGMFILFRSEVFDLIGGFDERYFMYLEDADICRRLSRRNYKTCLDPRCEIIHQGQRASRRNLIHFRWHVRSMFRFLFRF